MGTEEGLKLMGEKPVRFPRVALTLAVYLILSSQASAQVGIHPSPKSPESNEIEAEVQARPDAVKQVLREAEEQARSESEAAEQARSVEEATGTFDGAIRQKIERAWRRPASVPVGLSCVVVVRLGPGGTVLSAQVVRSSGNGVFDQSAERAVIRADPLPMPDEADLAARYRQGVELVFKPDG